MRTSVAVLLSIVILFGGITAVSNSAQESQDVAVTNGTNNTAAAYNMTEDVYTGVGQAMGPGVVWMGIAAIILVALGYLVVAGQSGR